MEKDVSAADGSVKAMPVPHTDLILEPRSCVHFKCVFVTFVEIRPEEHKDSKEVRKESEIRLNNV